MKKNIVIINSLYYPTVIGGAEVSTKILAEALSTKYNVYVITVGEDNRKNNFVPEMINNVKVFRLPHNNLYWVGAKGKRLNLVKFFWHIIDIFNVLQYKKVKYLLEQIKPEIVHTQNLPGLSLAVWRAAKDLDIPIVHTLRDYSLLNPVKSKIFSWIYKRISTKLSNYVSGVIGISDFILNYHINEGMFLNTQHFVVPNVIEGNVEIKCKDILDQPLHVAYFGQLSTNKGIKYLIEAVKGLSSNVVSRLYIYGDGALKSELFEHAKMDERIIFKGKLPKEEIPFAMSNVDLVIVPSIWKEPFGRVIIESYQVGTPVLASNLGGIPEVIINKSHLFEPNNVNAIKTSILNYRDLALKEKCLLSKKCIEYSRTFNVDNLLASHREIYESIIKQKGIGQ